MTTTWLTADPHFGHAGVCRFLRDDGTKLRPWDHYEEMDEALIANWNAVVRPDDRVYVLGDLVINRRALGTVGRCNGRKVLIKGNHDIFKLEDYVPYFDDIRGYHVLDNNIMSHIPIHEASLGRFGTNIHGHLHYREVYVSDTETPDPRYFCVSMERTDFTPISFDDVRDQIARRNEEFLLTPA